MDPPRLDHLAATKIAVAFDDHIDLSNIPNDLITLIERIRPVALRTEYAKQMFIKYGIAWKEFDAIRLLDFDLPETYIVRFTHHVINSSWTNLYDGLCTTLEQTIELYAWVREHIDEDHFQSQYAASRRLRLAFNPDAWWEDPPQHNDDGELDFDERSRLAPFTQAVAIVVRQYLATHPQCRDKPIIRFLDYYTMTTSIWMREHR